MTNMPNSDILHLAEYGLLTISGPKAEQLLQGQVSCDVSKITCDQGSLGVHCNPKGRAIYMFFITRIGDNFFLVMPKSMLEIAKKTLGKYAPFYKVDISESTEYAILGGYHNISENTAATIQLPTNDNRAIALSPLKMQQDATNEWQLQNILAGIPMIYQETTEVFLPHELNLQNLHALNFDKGCYTGQEIIARMHYRAKLKTKVCLALAEKHYEPGLELLNAEQKRIATVIDCSIATQNNYHALLITGNESDLTATGLTECGLKLMTNESEKQ